MAATRAQTNRGIRQEALREQLANKGLVQHVLDITDKLSELEGELEQSDITRLKYAADLQLKLISKYLPDLKAMEITGDGGNAIDMTWKIEVTEVSKS